MDVFEYIREFDAKKYNQPDKNWYGIVIHHSATKDGQVNDWEAIKRWHMGLIGGTDPLLPNYNPWAKHPAKDIGYHFGLEWFNGELVYRFGRPLYMQGAHTLYANDQFIGICVVGNYDMEEPRHEQYLMTGKICKTLMERWPIAIEMVKPHWNFTSEKTCPGKRFNILTLREYIRNI